MKSQTATVTGCGSGTCLCAGAAAVWPMARVNGVALHAPGKRPDPVRLMVCAHDELLRQQAVRLGLLEARPDATAPELSVQDRRVIETMLDRLAPAAPPTEADCLRYFETHRAQFAQGQALHVRHILFAVQPGDNVHAVAMRAEDALLELSRHGVPPERFAQLAAERSACATGARGGDLGWVGPEDCAPELANELFNQKHASWGMGVHPRLVHTAQGFHIVEVMGRRKGKPPAYEAVREHIAGTLAHESRTMARRHYLRQLVMQAQLEGVELEGADSPWMQ